MPIFAPAAPSPPLKAKGRSLSDFTDADGQLPIREQQLLDDARLGQNSVPAPKRPDQKPPDTEHVRADFIRFLMLGGDDNAPVHEKGVQLSGAWIRGPLDLDECKASRSALFEQCIFDEGIRLSDSSLINFALVGCEVGRIRSPDLARKDWAIFADRVKASQAIFIRAGSRVCGMTRMQAACISGDLDLSGSLFESAADGVAIDLIGARIDGDLEMNNFYSCAPLPLLHPSRNRDAFIRENANGTFQFRSLGQILLDNAKIGMRLRMIGSEFADAVLPPRAALSMVGITVTGGFFFLYVRCSGGVSLLGAKVGTLIDDLASWKTGETRHRFDGFVYDRIADESREVDRRRWLEMQRPQDLGSPPPRESGQLPSPDRRDGVRRQPWDQAARALDAVGDFVKAKEVRVGFERKVTWTGKKPFMIFRIIWDILDGYGYYVSRLFVITLLMWIVGAYCAYEIARDNRFTPEIKDAVIAKKVSDCLESANLAPSSSGWQFLQGFWCDHNPPEYVPVIPLLFSADTLAPVLDLRQKKAWSWNWGNRGGWFLLFESIYGYLAATALLAVVGSYIVRKTA